MTEQKQLIHFIKGFWLWWLAAFIVGGLAGYLAYNRIQPKYEGVVGFALTKSRDLVQKDTNFYLYDGYYSEQAGVSARNNLDTWVRSPQTVYAVYQLAGVELPKKSIESLGLTFQTNEAPEANSVDVSFSTDSRVTSEKLGDALIDYVRKNFKASASEIQAREPIVVEVKPASWLVTLVGAFGLSFFMFVATMIVHYLRDETA